MSSIRFLTMHYPYAEFSTVVSPAIERAVEEGKAPSTAILDFFTQDSITIGYFEDPEKCLDLDYCAQAGILVRRRRNTGGSILGGKGSAFLVLCLDVREPWVPMHDLAGGFRVSLQAMAGAMAELFGLDTRWRPLNDVEARGRKLVASSARLEKDVLTLRLVINVADVNPSILARAIKTPVEKMKDKAVRDPAQRVSSLERELGRKVGEQEILILAERTMKGMFGQGIRLVPGELMDEERLYAGEFRDLFSSEEWFWNRSQARRASSVPSHALLLEGLHKAPAGLIRVTMWVTEGVIQDLLITGDFHARPLLVVEELEGCLRGARASMMEISKRIISLLERPGVELPGVGKEDFLAPFGLALGTTASCQA
jgi:lipoate-protein ligase A